MNTKEFEKKIDYTFKNPDYLETALTHSSFHKEKNVEHKDNERLEFLGDAFFDAIVSVELFKRMGQGTEGKLTKTRALVVCEQSLAKVGRELQIGKYINMGHGEESAGGRKKESIIADAVEAIIGALYLDGGYEAASHFVVHAFSETIEKAVEGKLFSDYKSEVQELLQKKGKPVNISYEIDKEEGPAHDKTFFVHLECDGQVLGTGVGKSKKEAEQNAAKATLQRGENFDVF